MQPEIFDNFLPQDTFRKIADTIMSTEFPWHFSPGKTRADEIKENKNIFQFVHVFYMNHSWRSPYGEILHPILDSLKPYAIARIKANLTTITPEIIQYSYHRDLGESLVKSKTACFYINTNNGMTRFNSGEEVKSVANRLVLFESSDLHAGTSCTDEPFRIVINFNYFTAL
jgi:hypothetical protein